MAEWWQSRTGRAGRRMRPRYRAFSVFGGMAAALALVGSVVSPASAAPASAARASTAASKSATRAVDYHGYRVQVPASWPVYNLTADPERCVLFNTHAVYLGTPGASQDCPARAYGRTEALLIQPAPAASAVPKSAVVLPRDTAALPRQATALPAATAASTGHVIRVDATGSGVLVTASYGKDPALIRTILAGATMTTAGTAASTTATAAAGTAAAAQAGGTPTAPELAGMAGAGLGFDTCTAPSVATMTDWLASPYRVIGTYLGGVNWACDYGNFTASWVSQVAAEGWRFIPIWVGPQAPCSTIPGATLINPSQAAAEGQAEAASAVATAQSFGYGAGTPIYFDMEGYDSSDTACSQAVLTFLGGWTQGLHAAGYLSGVYSSAGSGITDLASEYANTSYPSPDAVWIADWDGNPVLSDPYLPDSDWAGSRLRQYAGGHNETWGGDTLNIDSDIIGGPVAGLPRAHVDAGPSLLAGPDAIAVAPGRTAVVRLTLRGAPGAPAAEAWQADPPAGITATPRGGRVIVPPGRRVSVQFRITPSASLAAGRYDVPVTFLVGSKAVAETFELVSVTAPETSLPTANPIVLYAADPASMASAVAIADADALPATDVTGSYSEAWSDLTGGNDLVIAVGQAAVDGLFYNACGWANPAGAPADDTPFYWLGSPFQQSPGADIYEPADGTTNANTSLLASQLTHYALAGTLPDYGRPPTELPRPTDTCLGSADVPVP
jgi:hypothetical protein